MNGYEAVDMARRIGFADAAIVSAEDFGAEGCLLLFSPYYAGQGVAHSGYIAVSGYYPVSNTAYFLAKQLVSELCSLGVSAEQRVDLPARLLAGRSGGAFGANGFYYHPQYGSYTHIQTVLVDIPPLVYAPAKLLTCCEGCSFCAEACPVGAVGGDIRECLRDKLNQSPLPDDAVAAVYQLFGCERCQLACPANPKPLGKPIEVNIERLLEGELSELQALVGKNIARPRRVKNQIEAFIRNNGE